MKGRAKTYNRRMWLNGPKSPSTGSVVAHHSETNWLNVFLEISDCHQSARLHKGDHDTVPDFIDKLTLLRNEISRFIRFLEAEYAYTAGPENNKPSRTRALAKPAGDGAIPGGPAEDPPSVDGQ